MIKKNFDKMRKKKIGVNFIRKKDVFFQQANPLLTNSFLVNKKPENWYEDD